jgi:hypothetical protein
MLRAAAVLGSCTRKITLKQFSQLLPNDSKAIYDFVGLQRAVNSDIILAR